MITFKLKRDDARIVFKYFLPYMEVVTYSRLRCIRTVDGEYLTCIMLLSLIQEIQKVFAKKLLTSSNMLRFNLNDACGVAFYKYLMEQPINHGYVYANLIRQKLCDDIHQQIILPDAPEDEIEEDFYKVYDYEVG